jgi:prolyl oligopeptidase
MRSCSGLTMIVACAAGLLMAPFCGNAARAAYPDAQPGKTRDTYFGIAVADPYRWMEQADSAPLAAFLKAQDDATHALFGTLAQPRARFFERIRQLQRGTASVRFVSRVADRYFFLETPSGAAAANLVVRAVAGGEKRVLLDPAQFGTSGGHPSIDFFSPSNDGRRIAVAVSHGGGEDWVLRFLDVSSGQLLPDQVGQIAEPFPQWTADGSSI